MQSDQEPQGPQLGLIRPGGVVEGKGKSVQGQSTISKPSPSQRKGS